MPSSTDAETPAIAPSFQLAAVVDTDLSQGGDLATTRQGTERLAGTNRRSGPPHVTPVWFVFDATDASWCV